MNRAFWKDKRVFITGHTGFKGGWLALWLADIGAEVHGFALPAPGNPNLFKLCNLETRLKSSTIADIRDAAALAQALQAARPHIVLHLAAQPLVQHSYDAPVETFSVNVMGTVHLLESVRGAPTVRAIVNVTTDKCYENHETVWSYREDEAMGGYDPYSSSKACSELVTAAYRRSFLAPSSIHIASARAGNVIGGGDWAANRLVPDFFRAVDSRQSLTIRYPHAIRPWQHVLEPLSGYLTLAEKLYLEGQNFAEAWNFGPEQSDARPVQWIVDHLCRQVPGSSWRRHDGPEPPHEANYLSLDISKAKMRLGWRPRWNLQSALDYTLDWYRAWKRGEDMTATCLAQIREYESCKNSRLQSVSQT